MLGAVTTIAVGWGFATSHGDNPPFGYLTSDVFSATGFAKVREQLTDSDFPEDSYLSLELEVQGDGLLVTKVETLPYYAGESWVRLRVGMPNPHLVAAKLLETGIEQRIVFKGEFGRSTSHGQTFRGNGGRVQTAVGWPLKSLSYTPSDSMRGSTNRRRREESVWHLPNVSNKLFPSTNKLTLPYEVLWPGFTINTLLYAAIVWVVWLSPFTARRMIRRKRGHCLKCGYDLRGAEHEACPECGVEV